MTGAAGGTIDYTRRVVRAVGRRDHHHQRQFDLAQPGNARRFKITTGNIPITIPTGVTLTNGIALTDGFGSRLQRHRRRHAVPEFRRDQRPGHDRRDHRKPRHQFGSRTPPATAASATWAPAPSPSTAARSPTAASRDDSQADRYHEQRRHHPDRIGGGRSHNDWGDHRPRRPDENRPRHGDPGRQRQHVHEPDDHRRHVPDGPTTNARHRAGHRCRRRHACYTATTAHGPYVQPQLWHTPGASGATVTLNGAAVNGGFLAVPARSLVTGGTALTGVTTPASTTINVTGRGVVYQLHQRQPADLSAGLASADDIQPVHQPGQRLDHRRGRQPDQRGRLPVLRHAHADPGDRQQLHRTDEHRQLAAVLQRRQPDVHRLGHGPESERGRRGLARAEHGAGRRRCS